MTKNPEYLKEFQALLHTLRGHVASLRKDRQKLIEDNRRLEESLGQALEHKSVYGPPHDPPVPLVSESHGLFATLADPSTRKRASHADLFKELGESDRIAMRQHIHELIECIDKHLSDADDRDEQTMDSGNDISASHAQPSTRTPGRAAAGKTPPEEQV